MRSPPPAVWRIEHVLHGTARGPGGSAELGEEIGDAPGRRARVRGRDQRQLGIADGRKSILAAPHSVQVVRDGC